MVINVLLTIGIIILFIVILIRIGQISFILITLWERNKTEKEIIKFLEKISTGQKDDLK